MSTVAMLMRAAGPYTAKVYRRRAAEKLTGSARLAKQLDYEVEACCKSAEELCQDLLQPSSLEGKRRTPRP